MDSYETWEDELMQIVLVGKKTFSFNKSLEVYFRAGLAPQEVYDKAPTNEEQHLEAERKAGAWGAIRESLVAKGVLSSEPTS